MNKNNNEKLRKGKKVNAKFDFKWWKWIFAVWGLLNIISITFWIIHVILKSQDKQKELIYSAKDEFFKTSFVTGVTIAIFVIIIAIFSFTF